MVKTEYLEKAQVLIEALPYIQIFGDSFFISVGNKLITTEEAIRFRPLIRGFFFYTYYE